MPHLISLFQTTVTPADLVLTPGEGRKETGRWRERTVSSLIPQRVKETDIEIKSLVCWMAECQSKISRRVGLTYSNP